MTGQVPGYLVRNLIDVALSRTETKPRIKPTKRTPSSKTCLAISAIHFEEQDDKLREVKALLKLHKRFENNAERILFNGVAKTTEKNNGRIHSSKLGSLHQSTEDSYLNEIFSKLSLPPSPELPALPSNESDSRHWAVKRLNVLKQRDDMTENIVLPALTDKPFSCGQDLLCNKVERNSKVKDSGLNNTENPCLQENLIIIPLKKENFALFDSLALHYGARSKYSSQSSIESPRNTKTHLRTVVPGSKSEDRVFIDFDKYLLAMSDTGSETSLRDNEERQFGGSEMENEHIERSMAVVEYKKNVQFSEDLHEVHLYSPVQNHWPRKRRKKRLKDR